MLLIEAFHAGGWPMYPILLSGVLLIAAAARYARSPEARHLQLVRELRLVTLGCGVLGSILGVIHSLSGLNMVPGEARSMVFAMGVSESINDVSSAILWTLLAGILTAIGALRAGAGEAARG